MEDRPAHVDAVTQSVGRVRVSLSGPLRDAGRLVAKAALEAATKTYARDFAARRCWVMRMTLWPTTAVFATSNINHMSRQ